MSTAGYHFVQKAQIYVRLGLALYIFIENFVLKMQTLFSQDTYCNDPKVSDRYPRANSDCS